ncbi:hypothetical protein NAL32_19775 [Chryseobacterium sp. Ch-15]|uniref:Uncharacterized protein n=1 Tax=Chryseobacterium muglaense TaxID=2893752 RepID=A0A9Q3YTQ8_9FLAO|nr:hypothetical protein [Chryseobacterium muglaense]MBD3906417.1 hypothetical protein [Chryseobacterium muglaense]MCC9037074.1 hypothetical protein [Chryseobacterium muglaense]MCM2556635.1 hypothetical protein [Chryseobacterium muglaense]
MKLYRLILFFQVSCIIILSCDKRIDSKLDKKDFVWSTRLVKPERIQELKSNKWKFKSIYVRNTSTLIVNSEDRIRFERIKNNTLHFEGDTVYINSDFVGMVDYKNELFELNGIDTLTNKYFIKRLKNNQLILENNVGFFKNKKLIKRFTIELFFDKDSSNIVTPHVPLK